MSAPTEEATTPAPVVLVTLDDDDSGRIWMRGAQSAITGRTDAPAQQQVLELARRLAVDERRPAVVAMVTPVREVTLLIEPNGRLQMDPDVDPLTRAAITLERQRADHAQAMFEAALREQAAFERAERERVARAAREREQAERERAEREQAQAAYERARRELAAFELAEQERAEREQAEQERAEREQAELEQQARAEREQAELEQQARAEQEQAELEQQARAERLARALDRVDAREDLKPEVRRAAATTLELAPAAPGAGRRRARWPWVTALLVVLLGVGLVVAGQVTSARQVAAAHADWTRESHQLAQELAAASAVLEESAGQVADDAVRQSLQDAIDAAADAAVDPSTAEAISVDGWHSATRDVVAAYGGLQVARQAAEQAHTAWQLGQAATAWSGARDALTSSIDSATSVLSASAGQVADDAVRQSLQSAIDEATRLRDAEPDASDLDAMTEATTRAGEVATSLDAQTQTVRDAQGTWQAEQVSIATQAQVDAAAEKAATAKPSTSTPATASKDAAPSPGSAAASIDPGTVSSSTSARGQVTVSAITTGITGPVVVTVGGVSQTIGVGSGSFTATITGLPAGSWSWSVSADGLTATGSGTAVVF